MFKASARTEFIEVETVALKECFVIARNEACSIFRTSLLSLGNAGSKATVQVSEEERELKFNLICHLAVQRLYFGANCQVQSADHGSVH